MKKEGGTVLIYEKMEALYTDFNERAKAAASSYSVTGSFLQYIHYVTVSKNHQKQRSRCLVHEY